VPPVDIDYQSDCGRDAPSTIESLKYNYDKAHEQMIVVHIPTTDEDGDSVISENLSTENMVNHICGNQPNAVTNFTDSLPDLGISTLNNDHMQQKGSSYITETNCCIGLLA